MQDWLYGAWTYRSLYNREGSAEKLEDILLAEGEMIFEAAAPREVRGQLAFRSEPPDPKDPRLTFAGSSEAGSPATAKFRGTGVKDTGAEGWVYDYVGYLVPHWPGGKDQATTLVGTVTRLLDHPGSGGAVRRAGDVYSFVAVRRDFPQPRTVIPIPEPALANLASRHHRLHHFVWHSVRNGWTSFTADLQTEIEQLGWAPPRPALTPMADPVFGNGSGEDFLFMHRQMVIEVNKSLEEAHKPPIEPWDTIPGPESLILEPDYTQNPPIFGPPGNPRGFSVPAWLPTDTFLLQRLAALKTADFYWSRMRWWDRQYKDPAYLCTLTLGELGSLLEWTVHNDMHMRWASTPHDPSTKELIPDGRPDWDIRPKWDDSTYDHLGEQYSSHVYPVFWRLHGWVDNRIEDWFRAHQIAHPGEVTRSKIMGTPWFEGEHWVQVPMPWPGPMDMHASMTAGAHGHESEDLKKMEQVIALIFPPPETVHLTGLTKRQPSRVRRRLTSRF